MKCPKCGENEVEEEDNRCSTDRGVYGSVNWICENCGDVTEYVFERKEVLENEYFEENFRSEENEN